MYHVKVNENTGYDIVREKDGFIVNGSHFNATIMALDRNHFTVIIQNKPINIAINQYDLTTKTYELTIDHKTIRVKLIDNISLTLEKLGMDDNQDPKNNPVLKAPMPGLISDILVSEGNEVNSGQPLIVLKAMKMENVLRSPSSGIIRKILVSPEQRIEKGVVLIQF